MSYWGSTVGKCIEFSLENLRVDIELRVNPFVPEPPVTARADPGPFYPL